ncbi:hypothetical protein [Burkholderia cenocepacia]|uniref:hypothetical protein n=1 Tax=Burkholderia cenocepacia TaxID=95486 RepID=UPI0013DF2429|nr:hypothetical protein [Burkholderia cenocepacia]MCW3587373.1 hypothetical protein [Burkholderia cenocepacia]MCW3632577.1 hypothetical protein [Burkholderia cenocepacia]MCW5181808.1 hypothetical protein [Burkholderia cenocepacia]NGO98061.1 hypothetical protein [Burkholderia cenocepacia]
MYKLAEFLTENDVDGNETSVMNSRGEKFTIRRVGGLGGPRFFVRDTRDGCESFATFERAKAHMARPGFDVHPAAKFAIGQKVYATVCGVRESSAIEVTRYDGDAIICTSRYGIEGRFTADELTA